MCDCKCNCKNYEKKEEKIKWEGTVTWLRDGPLVVPYGLRTPFQNTEISNKLAGKHTRITIEEV